MSALEILYKRKWENIVNNFDEIKKYKELLDSEIITQEEFDKKKQELLQNLEDSESNEKDTIFKKPSLKKIKENSLFKKLITKRNIIIVSSIVLAIGILIGGFFGVKAFVEYSNGMRRAEAVSEKIEPLLNEYDIYDYTVGKVYIYDYESSDNDFFLELYAEEFEDLTNSEKLSLIEELEKVSNITDPLGGDNFEVHAAYVYPDKDSNYRYYRVSDSAYYALKSLGVQGATPGLYKSYGDGAGDLIYEDDWFIRWEYETKINII